MQDLRKLKMLKNNSLYSRYLFKKIRVSVRGYIYIEGILREVSQYELLVETKDGLVIVPKSSILLVEVLDYG